MALSAEERDKLLAQEAKMFTTIQRATLGILKLLPKGVGTMVEHFSAKDRLDEDNLYQIMGLAHEQLEGEALEKAKKLNEMARAALEVISERYYKWAIARAVAMAPYYEVDPIEAQSIGGWALYRACFRFVPTTPFATYAEDWIRQGLERVHNRIYESPEHQSEAGIIAYKDADGNEVEGPQGGAVGEVAARESNPVAPAITVYDEGDLISDADLGGWTTRVYSSLDNSLGNDGSEGDDTYLDRVVSDLPVAAVRLEDRQIESKVRLMIGHLPAAHQSVVWGWWEDGVMPEKKEDVEIIKKFARRAGAMTGVS